MTTESARELSAGDVAARLDEIVREVRRQGRAAVAAQAAAEACLEQVTALARASAALGDEESDDDDEAAARPADDLSWLDGILPVVDAIDRTVAQARALNERRARPTWWPFGRPAPDPDLQALADGLGVLQAQLDAALAGCGITVDRRVGVTVDPEVHRVVEVRPRRGSEPEGVVVEVVRPGYAAPGRLVREADVVATGATLEERRQ